MGDRDFQWVFSGLWSCKTALTESPSGTALEGTNCTWLFYGSPAWALQTPRSRFHSAHGGQAWHIPLQPLTFPLSLNCSTLQETHSSCPQVRLKQLDPFQAQVGGKAPAPGDEVGRGSQAWEQAVSCGKGAIQGWETSLAPAWMRAQCISGPLPWRRQALGGKSCEMWEEEPGWRLPGNFNSVLDELPALGFCCRAQPANDETSDPPQAHSVHLSICWRSLLLASCPDCPANTWVSCGSTPKGCPKKSHCSQHRFAGAGFDPWDWAGAAAQIFLNQTGFLSTTQEKNANLPNALQEEGTRAGSGREGAQ